MPDNKRKKRADSKRIDVNDRHEVRAWTRSMGVTKERLLCAVKAVGTSASLVRVHMRSDRWTVVT